MSRAHSSLPELLTDEANDPDGAVTSQFVAAKPPAKDSEPLEIEASDILETREASDILETREASTARLETREASTARLEALVLTPRLPARPALPTARPRASHPSSIAPMALDIAAPAPSPPPPTGATTLQLARAAGVPVLSARIAVLATSVVGMSLIAGAVGAVLGYSHVSHAAATEAPALHEPHTAVVLEAREEVTEPPLTAPAKAPGTVTEEAATEEAASTTVAPTTTHLTAARRGGTGVVHVVGNVNGALVDGTPHRVVNNMVTVACGRHRVKLPGRSVRIVNVPCGGSTTF